MSKHDCGCHLKPDRACARCGCEEWEQLWYDTGERLHIGFAKLVSHAFDRWVCASCGEPAPGEAGRSHRPKKG